LNFPSIGAFVRHTATLEARMYSAVSLGVRDAAKVVHKRTRAKFGHYQEGDGPFSSWPELQDATKKERVRQGYSEDEPLLRSGDLMRSYTVEHEGLVAGVGSPLEEALGQEIGIPGHNVPARSTLGLAFVESERKGFGILNEHIGSVLVYGRDVAQLSDDLSELESVDEELSQ